jgi:hypothetical protein
MTLHDIKRNQMHKKTVDISTVLKLFDIVSNLKFWRIWELLNPIQMPLYQRLYIFC